jgi:hypothetical protein
MVPIIYEQHVFDYNKLTVWYYTVACKTFEGSSSAEAQQMLKMLLAFQIIQITKWKLNGKHVELLSTIEDRKSHSDEYWHVNAEGYLRNCRSLQGKLFKHTVEQKRRLIIPSGTGGTSPGEVFLCVISHTGLFGWKFYSVREFCIDAQVLILKVDDAFGWKHGALLSKSISELMLYCDNQISSSFPG